MNTTAPEDKERIDREMGKYLDQEEDIIDIKRELENSGVVDFDIDDELNIDMAEENV